MIIIKKILPIILCVTLAFPVNLVAFAQIQPDEQDIIVEDTAPDANIEDKIDEDGIRGYTIDELEQLGEKGVELSGEVSQDVTLTEGAKYNYKIPFENYYTGFDGDGYTYCGGNTDSAKQEPNTPPKPTMKIVEGLFGNAYKMTFYGFYIVKGSMRWGGTFVRPMSDGITLKSGSERLQDYMREVQNICFWAKAPHTSYISDTGFRTFIIKFQTLDSSGSGGAFEAKVKLANNGEWQYFKIPLSQFYNYGNATQPMSNYVKKIVAYDLAFTIEYGYSWFGREPKENDGSWENPWDEPLYVDELLFNRSTGSNGVITLPSIGEEKNFSDATLSGIKVDGVDVEDFDKIKNNDIIDVPVSAKYFDGKDLDSISFEAIPTITSSEGTAEAPFIQVRTGATVTTELPETVDGTGTIRVVAGDGEAQKQYSFRFVKGKSMRFAGISGVGPTIKDGNFNIRLAFENEGTEVETASAIAVVREKKTGEVASIGYGKTELNPGSEGSINISQVTVPTLYMNYELVIYTWDSLDEGKGNILYSQIKY